jgi:hypothetical protein
MPAPLVPRFGVRMGVEIHVKVIKCGIHVCMCMYVHACVLRFDLLAFCFLHGVIFDS